ncbi:50S ribosomal protein L4 [Alkalibacillus haloalkaliphilus]|uniref:Large ribosomal subunit protein uL4 n=1 Tax=Alkalibacillus haloalkaliphilus TaxID=94136 RepID=A0A511W7A8_9BACI|nr:50S ribosomal protein L4 [Alkalibacillus haloalkaliphilus]GEN46907.1 50S ribosomal protein L4 [Alkalibacillus haloalkaliphilus]
MPKVALYNQSGSQVGDAELVESVFGIEPNENVLHDAVIMQKASQRQGTHKVKGRSEVNGGGRKPWRQKGTGRARQGSIRSPQWVGGGTVFGPTPRSYSYKLPKKVRRLALVSALATKVKTDDIYVLDELNIDAPKTKEIVTMLNNFNLEGKTLIVTANQNENVERSVNNIHGVDVLSVDEINVLDLVKHDTLLITKEAADQAGEVLA